jgi:hypothetical protein
MNLYSVGQNSTGFCNTVNPEQYMSDMESGKYDDEILNKNIFYSASRIMIGHKHTLCSHLISYKSK